MDKKESSNRAWNDPPKISPCINQSQSSSKRLQMMKKRIPVPLNMDSSKKIATHSPLLIKPPQDTEIAPIFNIETKNISRGNDEILKFDYSELENFLINLLEQLCSSFALKEEIKEDIKKRLDILKIMWTSGKLSSEIQNGLINIGKALEEKNFDLAWSLHQKLMIDNTSECTTWILAIKTLIVESKKFFGVNSAELETSTEKQDQLYFNPIQKDL